MGCMLDCLKGVVLVEWLVKKIKKGLHIVSPSNPHEGDGIKSKKMKKEKQTDERIK